MRLNEPKWQAKMRIDKNQFQQRKRRKKEVDESWKAKVLRIKLTAEKVNKAIGYEN